MNTMLLFLIAMLSGTQGHARCTPPPERAWITISNPAQERDTVWFGFHEAGSYGIDAMLCEFDLPPIPPSHVPEARFVNIPGREGVDAPEGLGLGAYADYRLQAPGSRDTFRLRFQPGVSGYPVRLRWSPSSSVFKSRDSVVLMDELGGRVFRVRMDRDSTLTIAQQGVTSVLIVVRGKGKRMNNEQ